MNKDLEKKTVDDAVTDPAKHDVEVVNPSWGAFPFISFRYSSREVFSDGRQTCVRSKERSFENGKFKAEEFEGTLPAGVYSNMVGEMQKIFFNQITALLKPFSAFLPFRSNDEKR